MANDNSNSFGGKRTVILDQGSGNQNSDKATRILGQSQAGAAGQPPEQAPGHASGHASGGAPGGSRLPPTQIVGGVGGPPAFPPQGNSGFGPPGATIPAHGDHQFGPPPVTPPGDHDTVLSTGSAPGRPGTPPPQATRILSPEEIRGGPAPAQNWQQQEPGHASPPMGGPVHHVAAASPAPHDPPVVGWLVVVAGPGKGSFRPIFIGNNAVGRDSQSRVPLDFGDTSISASEQCFIRYDFDDRSFTFIPNLAKTNVVMLNSDKPMVPVQLQPYDEIRIGITKLKFVPFCGPDFDWADTEGQ